MAERMGGCLLQHKAKQSPGSVALLPGGAFLRVLVDILRRVRGCHLLESPSSQLGNSLPGYRVTEDGRLGPPDSLQIHVPSLRNGTREGNIVGFSSKICQFMYPHLASLSFSRGVLCAEALSLSYLSSQTLEGEIQLSSFFFSELL